MTTQTVELPEDIIERAKVLTGKRTARAAIVAVVDSQARRQGNRPNAATASTLRAKPTKRDKIFSVPTAAVAFLRKRFP